MFINSVDIYMNYKTSRLEKYGLFIMRSDDSFLTKVFDSYIRVYIDSYYYHIFNTVDTSICNDEVIRAELEGKRLEMLDDISIYELIDSNEEYGKKQNFINESIKIIPFLIFIDRQRFNDNDLDSIDKSLNTFLDIKERIGERLREFELLVGETNKTLHKFFKDNDGYYILDYQLYKEKDNYVSVSLRPSIPMLQENYKRSLLEQVYRSDKIKSDKLKLLINKFIKQLLFDIYNNNCCYEKYFIEIDDYLFTNKKDAMLFLQMLDNPLIKKWVVVVLSNNSCVRCLNMIKKFNFSLACRQDFSHIYDVSSKLSVLDLANIYDYVIVTSYKDRDLDTLLKYSCVNLREILFSMEM